LRAAGAVADGIAHDLSSFLAPILGYSDHALRRVAAGSPEHRSLKQVIEAAHGAKTLLRQLQRFGGQHDTRRRPVWLHRLVTDVLDWIRETVGPSISVHERSETHGAAVLADPDRMHHVVAHLCAGACEALGERGGTLDVAVATVRLDADFVRLRAALGAGTHVRVTIRGVPRERDDVVAPVAPVAPFGVALRTIHGIVVSHGGELTARGCRGGGVVFEVHLPAGGCSKAGGIALREAVAAEPHHLLVVDDEAETGRMTAQMLTALGYRTTVCTGGAQALRWIREQPKRFDLVVADQGMPVMTGAELGRELRLLRPGLPFVLLCRVGDGQVVDLRRGDDVAVVTKPVVARSLGREVRRILDRRQRRRNDGAAVAYGT
jgi:CheY-like chemotaxis protein